MDKILESFRKLREGLFATETRDIFAVQVYEQSILCSLYAGNIPELTKALQHLVHDLHPQVYKITPRADPSLLPEIPLERQRFLALYILHQVAKPIRKRVTSTSSSIGTLNLLSQTIAHPKTETDQLIASLLQVYEQLRQQRPSEYALESEVVFALAYWKSLRDGNWILRERLLSAVGGPSVCLPALLQNTIPISWEQRLMIQRSMGDSLGSARSMSVGMMSKAYYSLPVSVMAHAVGLTESQEEYTQTTPVDAVTSEQWVKELQASYGLAPSIIVRSGSLMFKAKS
ncbi:hypothetical protein BC939DRAFT_466999 [Gamsiella multidivaricata]|uniref:uncharacterized protein n=1 Tax=Gamsiella multidivaricata TaxID=101098 RepID=UPI00222082A7|nr:uncharacterized protein BC939DRAFT_466999 [Gamsiella multidivaricata]KAI7817089.1 hypothetical protein BC939DRAFT_466999 [Gamsiella multidivaricata]